MKPASYYADASAMAPGWGHYLRGIDRLRAKVEKNGRITFKDALWIAWAEGMSASNFAAIKRMAASRGVGNLKLEQPLWGVIIKAMLVMRERDK